MTYHLLKSLVALLALSVGAMAHPKGGASTAVGKAVYFITNDDCNAVVAIPIGIDGTLSKGTFTPTGGKGMVSIDGSTNETAKGDGLVSQSALALSGNVCAFPVFL